MAKKLDNTELENVSGGGCGKESKDVTVEFKVTYYSYNLGFPYTEKVKITFKEGKSDEEAVREWCKKYGYIYMNYERVLYK